ncbi:MAG TPA: HD domain-containing phosphohydrolase [Candidatus Dormibacteraeota bacterium]|nr:HD domain-containing phosphohydrolase [Candidatus Dormibacteraeota bacterium]
MPEPAAGAPRLAEGVAALSLATDMGTGKDVGRSLRIALLALHLGTRLGLSEDERSAAMYGSLLAMLGCTAESSTGALIFGDEIAFGAQYAPLVNAPRREMMGWILRHFAEDERFARRLRRLATMMTAGRVFFATVSQGHCEVARRLAGRIGVDAQVGELLGAVFERWDGTGAPRALRGDALPLPVRIGHVCWDVDTFGAAGGRDAWTALLRRRSGVTLDPLVVEAALADPDGVDACLAEPSPWDALLAAEPQPWRRSTGADALASVIADFVDLKFDRLAGHSRAVAALAGAAAAQLGLDSSRVDSVRRAGLVHDLGRVAVSASVWDKPGPLSDGEWESVRLHAYHAERILGRTSLLAEEAALAAMHHERCDGSGYHRGCEAASLPLPARVLAAADAFAGMTEPRAHRPAMDAAEAARTLAAEARAGRLDPDAVEAVVQCAGESARVERPAPPAGLSEREVEVLRLLARGMATKQVGSALGISAKTADHHVQSAYRKIGVATRAGAAVFAMEHGLLS